MTLARLVVLLGLDSRGFQLGLAQAQRQLAIFRQGMAGIGGGMNMAAIGRGLTYGLTLPLIAAGAAVGVLGSNLASEMSRVQSVIATPGNARSGLIGAWTDDVQQLGVTLGRTSPEVASGLYEIVSAFGDIGNATQFLEIAGRAAVAGQSDIATSTKNLVLMTRAWGDSSTQAVRRMADLGSATVRVGTLTEQEMGGAMAGLLPIMKLYGVQLEQGFAGLASLAGVSGSASQASTQLQRAITSLVAPNQTMLKLYKQYGIESGELLIEQKGLVGAFKEISRISDETHTPLQKMLGRLEAVKAVATLTGPQFQAYTDNLAVMAEAAGDVDRAFAGATGGIGKAQFEWQQATQRMRVIAESLYLSLAPAASNVAKSLAPIGKAFEGLAQGVASLDTGTLTVIVWALLALATIGPVASIISGIGSAIGLLGAAAASAWGPVGLVAAALWLVWLAYQNDWWGFATKVTEAWAWIEENAKNLAREIEQLRDAIGEIANPPVPEGPGEETPGFFMRYSQALKEFMDVALQVWLTIGQQAAGFRQSFKQGWDSLWSGLTQSFSRWGESIRIGIGLALGAAALSVGQFATAIRTGLALAWAGVVQSIGTLVSGMKTGFSNAISAAKDAVGKIAGAFKISWSSIGSSIASGIASGISAGVRAIKDAAVGAATAALNAAKSALGIKSPSRVFRDAVGYQIPAGMAQGIYQGAWMVNRALTGLATPPTVAGGGGVSGLALAGAGGGGGSTTAIEVSFGDIIIQGGPATAGKVVVESITSALQRRGLI